MSFILSSVRISIRHFCWKPILDSNCFCPGVHFSIPFKYSTVVHVLCLFSLPFASVRDYLFLCYVSRQQHHSFAELKFSSISSPFINRLAKALVSQILMTRIVREHPYFIT